MKKIISLVTIGWGSLTFAQIDVGSLPSGVLDQINLQCQAQCSSAYHVYDDGYVMDHFPPDDVKLDGQTFVLYKVSQAFGVQPSTNFNGIEQAFHQKFKACLPINETQEQKGYTKAFGSSNLDLVQKINSTTGRPEELYFQSDYELPPGVVSTGWECPCISFVGYCPKGFKH